MNKKDYIKANREWLEAKAAEEGVKALPKGIYYKEITKGDANDPQDSGYITQDQIVGVVSGFKLRGLGWPTIWLRDIFK